MNTRILWRSLRPLMLLVLFASAASAGVPQTLTLGDLLETAARQQRFRSLHGDLDEAPERGAMRPLPFPTPGADDDDDGRMRPLVFDPLLPFEPGPEFVPGEVLVTFAEGVDLATARALVGDLGYTVAGENLFGTLRILTVRVPAGDEDQALKQLRGHELVDAAHLNHIARIL